MCSSDLGVLRITWRVPQGREGQRLRGEPVDQHREFPQRQFPAVDVQQVQAVVAVKVGF